MFNYIMNTTKRCKKGERKNKQGICEKKPQMSTTTKKQPIVDLISSPLSSPLVIPSPLSAKMTPLSPIPLISQPPPPPPPPPATKKTTRTRCKKGERKNKQGICKKKPQMSTTKKQPTTDLISTPLSSQLISQSPLILSSPLSAKMAPLSPIPLISQSQPPPQKTTRARCKKGERKNKQGICDPHNPRTSVAKLHSILPPQISEKIKKTRCKKDERKNKLGVCEKTKISSLKPQKSKQHNITKSYRPSVNKRLVSIKTGSEMHNIKHCNKFENNLINFPLKIEINGKCTAVQKDAAKQYLLKELKKNKHLNIQKIILPKQYDNNCWFNTFFTCMFISDKGRQFSLFFRQLMIEGKLYNNDVIPAKLINVFSLLNYFIHCCLAGDKFALDELNTNTIINYIYKNIPKNIYKWVKKPQDYGNPFWFFQNIIKYLSINSINLGMYGNLETVVFDYTQVPDIMILQYDENNNNKNKQKKLTFGKYKYELDSACIIDNTIHHFCCLIHCNKKEYSYDGATNSRLQQMQWTHLLNKDNQFTFSYNDTTTMHFNFLKGYSMLVYYRKS